MLEEGGSGWEEGEQIPPASTDEVLFCVSSVNSFVACIANTIMALGRTLELSSSRPPRLQLAHFAFCGLSAFLTLSPNKPFQICT